MSPTRLYIPPRTHLETVWRVQGPNNQSQWQIWTACLDRNAPFHQMMGTCMQLGADGRVTRVTYRPDDTESIIEVMEKMK